MKQRANQTARGELCVKGKADRGALFLRSQRKWERRTESHLLLPYVLSCLRRDFPSTNITFRISWVWGKVLQRTAYDRVRWGREWGSASFCTWLSLPFKKRSLITQTYLPYEWGETFLRYDSTFNVWFSLKIVCDFFFLLLLISHYFGIFTEGNFMTYPFLPCPNLNSPIHLWLCELWSNLFIANWL